MMKLSVVTPRKKIRLMPEKTKRLPRIAEQPSDTVVQGSEVEEVAEKGGAPKFLRRAALCMRDWTWAFGSVPGSEEIALVDEEGRGLTFVDEREVRSGCAPWMKTGFRRS